MKTMIPYGDIQYLSANTKLNTKVFAIKSPLTHEWSAFEIDKKLVYANCLPANVEDYIGYYETITRVLSCARDFRAMDRDLTALDAEEVRIFGLRLPQNLIQSRKGR